MPVANRVWTSASNSSGSSREDDASTISIPVTARDFEAYQRWCCDPFAQALLVEALADLGRGDLDGLSHRAGPPLSSTSWNQ